MLHTLVLRLWIIEVDYEGVRMKRLENGYWYTFDVISDEIVIGCDNCILCRAKNEKEAILIIKKYMGLKEEQ